MIVERDHLRVKRESELRNLDFEQHPAQILDAFMPLYLNSQILRAVEESFASDLAARMNAISNATDNAVDLKRNLLIAYNRERQAEITAEILEIVAGADTLYIATLNLLVLDARVVGSSRVFLYPHDAAANESKKTAPAAVDGLSSVSQHSSGYQPTWGGVPCRVSMADIVKMAKPQSKVPSVPNHRSTDEEWPLIDQPSVASQPSISEPPTDSELHPDPVNISYDRINHQTEIDEVQGIDDSTAKNLGSPPSIKLQERV
ncbi:atp synthase gamma chain 2, chloroplastic [Nicotiana attenuata]|uniref:Atp synthase gamma chain 2, chloroplastic n=1 Tax=Nicotiana attenuata TaxID=49451 RepID=A0A314KR05_NICAT|nr:atp synthase gamma chain 2, chloroplastic [Nicotiana attenuata]